MSEFDKPNVSGKSRNWFARHPKYTVFFAFLVLLGGTLFFSDRQATLALEERIEAIRASGSPMTVKDLQTLDTPVPDKENLTRAVLTSIAPLANLRPPQEIVQNLPVEGIAILKPIGQPMPKEQLEAANWYLAQRPDAVRSLHDAASLKNGWFDYGWQILMVDMPTTQMSRIRTAAKTLMIEVLVTAESQDQETAGHRVMELFQVARATDNAYPTTIGFLTQLAVVALAEDATSRAINRCGLNIETLVALENPLVEWQESKRISRSIKADRVAFLAISNPSHSQTQRAPGQTCSSFIRYLPILPARDVIAGLDAYSAMLTALERSEQESLNAAKQVESEISKLPAWYVFSKPRLAGSSYLIVLWLRSLASARALQVAIACERFRLLHDRWPVQLEEVVTGFIEAIPKDPFDGAPIRYAIIPEGIKVWSIGDDLKNDGGEVGRLQRSGKRTDWGWVILNPDRRGLAQPEASAITSNPSSN